MAEYIALVPNLRQITSGPLDPDEPPEDPTTPFAPLPNVSDVQIDVEGYPPPSLPES
jgi:hypothetical protein